MQLIHRSYLEQPEKYKLPRPVKEIAEVGVLKPQVTGLEVHEYPNEHVIVLQGENLWFSYKICLDYKGPKPCLDDKSPNHHEIETPTENTTRRVIEFHIADSDSACSALHSGKPVKVALYTHFAKPIRQTINTKKVSGNYIFSIKRCS